MSRFFKDLAFEGMPGSFFIEFVMIVDCDSIIEKIPSMSVSLILSLLSNVYLF